MLSARIRTSAGAAALAFTGALIFAGPAQAAETTITLSPQDVAFVDEPLRASGTCTDGSRTAVVTVTQTGDVLDQVAVDLDATLAYSVSLDLSDGSTDLATARVECFRYADAAPIGTKDAQFFLAADDSFDMIHVTVNPTSVHVGGTLTISGKCPAGTLVAEVLAGDGELDQPFLDETVIPAADGTVSLTTTVRPGEFVRVGDALAVIACGDAENPTAVGFADFRVLAAVAAPAPSPAAPVPPASAVPQLAATGSENGPLTAVGLGLVLAGAGLYRLRRMHGLA
ncbi:LPXTG cell wall anchor domain-containing protein [Pedococcus sp. 5OH_020]|uniref:LPXTG cell wall anchor domain-containing protein n=1 Tax=Pedococcus sp. 5OH_020 TaxID=2989814 RepID=UPI0022E9B77C|nr:LPXTG cell wall anchor domain-containing protein [Pedococcus sp. 5OH_020]